MALPSSDNTHSMVTTGTPSGDLSNIVLDNLFGMGWENYFGGNIGPGPFTLFFDLLKYLNAMALTVATVLIVYVALIGVAGSAHEGVPLGRRYSTLWTPIRSVMAIASLIPIPGIGISTLQGIVLLAVGLSVNGANHLWNQSIDYMKDNTVALAAIDQDLGSEMEATVLSQELLKTITTQTYLFQMDDNGFGVPAFSDFTSTWIPDTFSLGYLKSIANPKRSPEDGEGGTYYIEFTTPDSMSNLVGELGGVTIPCESKNTICDLKQEAVINLIDALFPIAENIVSGTTANPSALKNAVNQYKTRIATINTSMIRNEQAGFTAAVDDFSSKAKQGGWILAGSWYWTIASIQERSRDLITDHRIQSNPMDTDTVAETVLDDYQGIMASTRSYTGFSIDDFKKAAQLEKTIEDESFISGVFKQISRAIRDGFLTITEYLVVGLTEGDPIQNLKTVGDTIILTGETVIAGYLGFETINFIKDKLTGKNIMATNLEAISQSASKAANTRDKFFTAMLLLMILTPLFLLGLLLAYYLPSLPFFLWFSGIITWFLLVIEALFAAPIIAVAIAIPEGEGAIGPHARRSILLIANLVFRPPLMIAVFFFVYFAIKGIVWIIGVGYILFYNGLHADAFIGPLTVVMTVLLIGTFLIVVIDRIFSLINEAPAAIFNWIEGGASHLGGDGGVYDRTRQTATSVTAGTGAAVSQGTQSIRNAYKGRNTSAGKTQTKPDKGEGQFIPDNKR